MRRKLAGTLAMIFAAAVIAAGSGCRSPIKYSQFRSLAEEGAKKAGSNVTRVVPYGGEVGKHLGSKTAELVFGPDVAKELKKINSRNRFRYSFRGLPVRSDFWFKFVGLNPKMPADKRQIDFVETVARQAKLSPEEVMFVIGTNAHFTVRQLEEERLPQLERALKIAASQIKELETDLDESFFPKSGPRKKALKHFENLCLLRELFAEEYVALEKLLELGKLSHQELNEIMNLGRNRLYPAACRAGLVTFVSSTRD